MNRLFLVLILVPCLLTAACTGATVKRFGELQTLYAALTKKFADNVNVEASEGPNLILTITYINSPLNEKNHEDRRQRAAETAHFVKTQYQRIQSVEEIWVVFMRQQTRLFIFHSNLAFEFYTFDKDANEFHQSPQGPPPPPDETAKTSLVRLRFLRKQAAF